MTSNVITLEIPAQQRFANVASACVNAVIERVTDGARAAQLSHDVQLALQEVVTNIIDHAYEASADASSERITFRMTWEPEQRRFTIDTRDNGTAFDTASVPTAKWRSVSTAVGMCHELAEVDEPSWDQESGRGFFLLINLIDRVVYQRGNNGNHWQLTKCL